MADFENDGFEDLDNLLDEGFDSDNTDTDNGKKKRKADETTLNKIKAGVKDSLAGNDEKIKKNIRKVVEEAMPSIVGSTLSKSIKDIESEVSSGLDGIKSKVKEEISPVLDTARELSKGNDTATSIINKISNFLDIQEQRTYNEKSQDEIISDRVSALIKDSTLTSDTKSKFDALQTKESMKDTKTLVEVSKLGFELANYNTALHEKYYRKSLELKYKNIYEIKQLRSSMEKRAEVTDKLLDGIKHNTGLPDAVKLHMSDSIKHRTYANISDALYKSILGDSNWSEQLGHNIKNKMGDVQASILNTIGGVDFMLSNASMLNGMVDEDMLAMMSPEDRMAISKEGIIAGMATDGFLGMAGRAVGSRLSKTKYGKKARNKAESFALNPEESFRTLADNSGTIGNKLFNFLGDMVHTDTNSLKTSIKGSENLTDPKNFDVRTYQSINNVIPALLSKILGSVDKLNGGTGEEIKYDHNKKQFISTGNFKQYLTKDIAEQYKHRATEETNNRRLDSIVDRSNVNLTDKEKKKLHNALFAYDGPIDAKYIDRAIDNGLFDGMSDQEKLKFSSVLTNAGAEKKFNKDGDIVTNVDNRYDINRLIRGINKSKLNAKSRIEALINDGFEEELIKVGVLKKDKITGNYKLDIDTYNRLNIDALSGSSDIDLSTTKPNIKSGTVASTKSDTTSFTTGVTHKSIIDNVKEYSANKLHFTNPKDAIQYQTLASLSTIADRLIAPEKPTKKGPLSLGESMDRLRTHFTGNDELEEGKDENRNGIRDGSFKEKLDTIKNPTQEALDSMMEKLSLSNIGSGISDTIDDTKSGALDAARNAFFLYRFGGFLDKNGYLNTIKSTTGLDKGLGGVFDKVNEYTGVDLDKAKDTITDPSTFIQSVTTTANKMKEAGIDPTSFIKEQEAKFNSLFKDTDSTIFKSTSSMFTNLRTAFTKEEKEKTTTEQAKEKVSDSKVGETGVDSKHDYDKNNDGIRDGSWLSKLKDRRAKYTDNHVSKTFKSLKDNSTNSGMRMLMSVLGFGLSRIYGSLLASMDIYKGIFNTVKGIGSWFFKGEMMKGIGAWIKNGIKDLPKGIWKVLSKPFGVIYETLAAGFSGVVSAIEGSAMLQGLYQKGKKVIFGNRVSKMLGNTWKKLGKTGKFGLIAGAVGAGAYAYHKLFGSDEVSVDPVNDTANTIKATQNVLGDYNPIDDIKNQVNSSGVAVAGAMGLGANHIYKKMKKDPKLDALSKSTKSKIKASTTKKVDSSVVKNLAKKGGQKTAGKLASKLIPIAGMGFELASAASELGSGNSAAAGMHMLAGIATFIPYLGLPLSIAADMYADKLALDSEREEAKKAKENEAKYKVYKAGRKEIEKHLSTEEVARYNQTAMLKGKDAADKEFKIGKYLPKQYKTADDLPKSTRKYYDIYKKAVGKDAADKNFHVGKYAVEPENYKSDRKIEEEKEFKANQKEIHDSLSGKEYDFSKKKFVPAGTAKEPANKKKQITPIMSSKGVNPGVKVILEGIASIESKTGEIGYNVIQGFVKVKEYPDITKLTLDKLPTVMALAKKNGSATGALGKYQIMSGTLSDLKRWLHLSGSELFSPAMQDKMAIKLLNNKGLTEWISGTITNLEFMHKIAETWAAVPDPQKGGKSKYSGVGNNKSGMTVAKFNDILNKARKLLSMPPEKYTVDENGNQIPLDKNGKPIDNNNTNKSSNHTGGALAMGLKSAIKAALEFFGVSTEDTGAEKKLSTDGKESTTQQANDNIGSYKQVDKSEAMKSIQKVNTKNAYIHNKNTQIRYSTLCPEARRYYDAFSKYMLALGIKVQIPWMGGNRSLSDQQLLYSKGRTRPGKKITWTLHSYHRGGRAIDIISSKGYKDPKENQAIAKGMRDFAKSHPELGAGFLAHGKDPNHVQFPNATKIAEYSAEDIIAGKSKPITTSNVPEVSVTKTNKTIPQKTDVKPNNTNTLPVVDNDNPIQTNSVIPKTKERKSISPVTTPTKQVHEVTHTMDSKFTDIAQSQLTVLGSMDNTLKEILDINTQTLNAITSKETKKIESPRKRKRALDQQPVINLQREQTI